MIGRSIGFLACATLLAGCGAPAPVSYQGYAEGEFVLVASPYAGSLARLAVARGQMVEAGAPLFELEQENEVAARRESEQLLRAAQARVANLHESERKARLQGLEATVQKAAVAVKLSELQFRRDEQLRKDGFISAAGLDQARTTMQRDAADLEQSRAQLRLARQSIGRPAELEGARAEAGAAEAAVAQADWKLGQKTQRAPSTGLVQDTFFVPGEWVPAGKPVVNLLPPANVKVRFFVPETIVGGLRLGATVRIACDGCGAAIEARLSYVSSRPEYTPPVIYSKESRAKLVFMVEARPSLQDAPRLKPGQPLDVTLP